MVLSTECRAFFRDVLRANPEATVVTACEALMSRPDVRCGLEIGNVLWVCGDVPLARLVDR